MSYIELHKKIGFKVGERVKVTAVAESQEKGWNNQWVMAMNRFVGKEGVITNDYMEHGLEIEFDEGKIFRFPAFVLELVTKRRSKKQQQVSMKNFASGTVTGQINLLSNFEQKNRENQFLTRDQLEQMQKCIIDLKILRQLLKKLT